MSASPAVVIPTPTPAPPVPATANGVTRAAFYYNWFPETWTVNGAHVAYSPLLNYYSSTDVAAVDSHIRAMDYANIDLAIVSWWGTTSAYQSRVALMLDRIAVLGSPLRVGFYYEKESLRSVPQAEITSDLLYLRGLCGTHPRCRTPLTVFVYNTADATCAATAKWESANTIGAFVDLKVFSGYAGCSPQPDGWHQYGPASAEQNIADSFAISPGFWRADEGSPRLPRDLARWKQDVRDMVASGKQWQLITTFNEWGEGTAVEAAREWTSSSGFGAYLDALHTDGR